MLSPHQSSPVITCPESYVFNPPGEFVLRIFEKIGGFFYYSLLSSFLTNNNMFMKILITELWKLFGNRMMIFGLILKFKLGMIFGLILKFKLGKR
jgi:hypothetical protein